MEANQSRAWEEVSLRKIAYNYVHLNRLQPDSCEIMAVVKADAYGHGAVRVARFLETECGCTAFAVATAAEAVQLREAGIGGLILVLGYVAPAQAAELATMQISVTVADEAHAVSLSELDRAIPCHVAVDTGMNRLGVRSDDLAAVIRILNLPGLSVQGIFSHFCVADSDDEDDLSFTDGQIQSIYRLKSELENLGYTLSYHMQSSFGLIRDEMVGMRYARTGIALYGCVDGAVGGCALRPALSVYARVVCIRNVEPDESVSYGRTFIAQTRRQIAVVSIGYADGVPRHLSNKGTVLIKGRRCRVVGRVCMDQLMADITDVPGVFVGDRVILIGTDETTGETITAMDMADAADTIAYEILCGFNVANNRVPRLYV